MKNANKLNRVITEELLDEKFATKKDLEAGLQQIVQDIADIEGVKLEENDRKWVENDRKWAVNEMRWDENERRWEENDKRWEENDRKLDRILSGQDKIVGMLENWQIENEVGTNQIRELRVDVDNHEKRITKLEHSKN